MIFLAFIRTVDDDFIGRQVPGCEPEDEDFSLDSQLLEEGFYPAALFFDVGLIFDEDCYAEFVGLFPSRDGV